MSTATTIAPDLGLLHAAIRDIALRGAAHDAMELLRSLRDCSVGRRKMLARHNWGFDGRDAAARADAVDLRTIHACERVEAAVSVAFAEAHNLEDSAAAARAAAQQIIDSLPKWSAMLDN